MDNKLTNLKRSPTAAFGELGLHPRSVTALTPNQVIATVAVEREVVAPSVGQDATKLQLTRGGCAHLHRRYCGATLVWGRAIAVGRVAVDHRDMVTPNHEG